ncbi:HPr family phosphocarrier protein [Haloferacaceae archaeon DSL9]
MERIVTVVPEAGLHARPAAKFVETAGRYDSDVTVEPADGSRPSVAADSMLAVTGLGVKGGDDVKLVANGDDSEAVLDALEAVLSETVEEADE